MLWKSVELVNKTDWTSEFRNGKMFLTIDMKRWILIYPARAKMEAQQFIQALQQAGRGMNFNIESPKMWVLFKKIISTTLITI